MADKTSLKAPERALIFNDNATTPNNRYDLELMRKQKGCKRKVT
jgi:hypothetical protein